MNVVGIHFGVPQVGPILFMFIIISLCNMEIDDYIILCWWYAEDTRLFSSDNTSDLVYGKACYIN